MPLLTILLNFKVNIIYEEEVYPNFVQMGSNGYYSVNYQELIPFLTKGIQEQQAQIEALKQASSYLKKSLQTTTLAVK